MSEHHSQRFMAWQRQLQAVSTEDQIDALRQISTAGPVRGLTGLIVRLAGHHDDEVRMWAAEALESSVQPDASEQLLLIQLLESSHDSEICYWSATMLGRLGTEASAAARALQRCASQSGYLPARERATWALSQIGPAARIAIPTLQQAAETAPPRLRRLATATLQTLEDQDATSTAAAEEAA